MRIIILKQLFYEVVNVASHFAERGTVRLEGLHLKVTSYRIYRPAHPEPYNLHPSCQHTRPREARIGCLGYQKRQVSLWSCLPEKGYYAEALLTKARPSMGPYDEIADSGKNQGCLFVWLSLSLRFTGKPPWLGLTLYQVHRTCQLYRIAVDR